MKHIGTRELETERLLLRKISVNDAEAMYNNWASDDVVTRYIKLNPLFRQSGSFFYSCIMSG